MGLYAARLQEIADEARAPTGARYAAITTLAESGEAEGFMASHSERTGAVRSVMKNLHR